MTVSEVSKEAAPGEYTWLEINNQDDYRRLIYILNVEFEPEVTACQLKNNISSEVSGILVEHDYIDKDYRSTFYNFHAKMGPVLSSGLRPAALLRQGCDLLRRTSSGLLRVPLHGRDLRPAGS